MSVIGRRSGISRRWDGYKGPTNERNYSLMRLKSMDNIYPRMAGIMYCTHFNHLPQKGIEQGLVNGHVPSCWLSTYTARPHWS